MLFPLACETGVTQDRVGDPSTCTVQAPHNPAPQPNFVPVSASVSRNTQSSGVSGETLTFFSLPLTRSVMSAMLSCVEAEPTMVLKWKEKWKWEAEGILHDQRTTRGAKPVWSAILHDALRYRKMCGKVPLRPLSAPGRRDHFLQILCPIIACKLAESRDFVKPQPDFIFVMPQVRCVHARR